ncbi:MAG: hypothetical protein JWP08_3485 [Bryobacterales bacterium]|nr:hypothetical protein [Bryobacterales bacterium]
MMLRRRTEQLNCDADAISRPPDRAFHQSVHLELTGDLGQGSMVFLYRITEVREMTRNESILANSVMSSSVMPSAR